MLAKITKSILTPVAWQGVASFFATAVIVALGIVGIGIVALVVLTQWL